MYFVFGLPKDSGGYTGIVVFIDRFSKMDQIAAVPDSIEGKKRYSYAVYLSCVSSTRVSTGNHF